MGVLKAKVSGNWSPIMQDAVQTFMVSRSIFVVNTNTAAGSTYNTDYVYVCSATLTLTLPTAVGNKSRYTVKRSGTGNVTIATTANQTIDGATSFVIDTQWESIDLVSDNTNWVIV